MTIGPLFTGLFDDAALFPPGNAPMPAAIAGHQRHRLAAHAGLVGWFVCPASRLSEAATELAQPLAVSITVPDGPAGLAGALRQAGEHPMIRAEAVELPAPLAELDRWLDRFSELTGSGLAVFVEVPVAELTPVAAKLLASSGLGLKLRTGGTSAHAFPSATELGQAIEIATAAGGWFKCTAGLHNAIAHTDPATGFDHHGFINVLLAVQAARTGDDPRPVLAQRSAGRLAEQVGGLTGAEVAELRGQFRSIGSCSITEPLTDLENLGLVGTE